MRSRAAISGAMIGLIISMSAAQARKSGFSSRAAGYRAAPPSPKRTSPRMSPQRVVPQRPARAVPRRLPPVIRPMLPRPPATARRSRPGANNLQRMVTGLRLATLRAEGTPMPYQMPAAALYLAMTAVLCSFAAATTSGGTAFWCFSSSSMKASPAALSLNSHSLFFTPSKISE